MKETRCEAVRRELEELMLDDEFSAGATQHLRECRDCSEFHQQQTKLRQIVGSLGTVEAPADFDFRLRARLANESSAGGFHLRLMQRSLASKGFAAAAMVLLFVVGMVYVWTVVNKTPEVRMAEQRNEPVQPAPKPSEEPAVVHDSNSVVASSFGVNNATQRPRGERRVVVRTKPSATIDSSSERAPLFSGLQHQSTIFPIDASLQSLKVSFDDGRGNARTISVPTITFGSQRVLPVANQFNQKNAW